MRTFRSYLHWFPPELEFRVDSTVYEVVIGWHMESTDWWMVADLFTYNFVSQLWPEKPTKVKIRRPKQSLYGEAAGGTAENEMYNNIIFENISYKNYHTKTIIKKPITQKY